MAVAKLITVERSGKVRQDKISIPSDEWRLVVTYYAEHPEEMKLKGIRSPTMLLRRWMLEKYSENTAHGLKKQ